MSGWAWRGWRAGDPRRLGAGHALDADIAVVDTLIKYAVRCAASPVFRHGTGAADARLGVIYVDRIGVPMGYTEE
jgi:hypothetical protein